MQRQRQRKRQLKSELVLFQTLLILSHSIQFVKCWAIFQELILKDCI